MSAQLSAVPVPCWSLGEVGVKLGDSCEWFCGLLRCGLGSD